ncbi:hypothetical protein KEJ45_00265 [Candidatus Bathyarchaeota archaeon]|nr:hypothetical protein [Candidatus Bathyarchaeota archaeon]
MSNKSDGNDYLFEIAVFLATSARNCIDEPPLYGPFRLLDALSKIADLPKYAPCLKDDPFLQEIKAFADEKKFLVMYGAEEFKKALDEIVEMFAKELKKRYLEKQKETG